MDEFHISPEQIAELKKSFKRFAKSIGLCVSTTLIDTLEPYQRYELAHPKKKPRGSIRRKRHERKKNRNSLTGVNMYIDDIYDIVAIEDNKRR